MEAGGGACIQPSQTQGMKEDEEDENEEDEDEDEEGPTQRECTIRW